MKEMRQKQLDGKPIYYWIGGDPRKETILFLHSAFSDHRCFDEQINFFINDYQIIMLDLIGHGKSVDGKKGEKTFVRRSLSSRAPLVAEATPGQIFSLSRGSGQREGQHNTKDRRQISRFIMNLCRRKRRHVGKDVGLEKMADYIHQLLIFESIERVHLVGVSIGGILAQDFSNHYPDFVASIFCVGAYDINNFDKKMQKENNAGQAKLIIKALFSIKWFAESNRKISAFTPNGQDKYYQMNLGFKRSSFRYFTKLSKIINVQSTKKRDYPLTIACGEKDAPLAVKASRLWHDREPESQLVFFENAGHHVNLDLPYEFNVSLMEHLK